MVIYYIIYQYAIHDKISDIKHIAEVREFKDIPKQHSYYLNYTYDWKWIDYDEKQFTD